MKARIAVLATLLVAPFICAAANKPNILLIMVDDLNTMIDCFDGPAITPNIDALSTEGIRFTNAYSACPSCNPSRTAMFTGQRPERNGVFNNSQPFRDTEPAKFLTTLPQYLKANGYNTIASGKIFHARRGGGKEPNPHSDPQSWTYQADIDAGLFFGQDFKKNMLDENGVPKWVSRATGRPTTKADKKKVKSTWSYGPIYVEPTNTLDFNSGEFGAAYLMQDSSDPLVKIAPDPDEKPFFLACGFFRPHIPILAPIEFFELYETPENRHRLELPEWPEDDMDDLPKAVRSENNFYVDYIKGNLEEQKRLRHAYMAATSYADAAVGKLLDGLNQSPYRDNTIVIFMGDHGYQLGEKNRVGKSKNWRGASGMPMIVRMPNGATGVCDKAVSMLDLYPTVLEWVGLDAPQILDGVSLVPLLKDPSSERKAPAVISVPSGSAVSVALDQWHYIQYRDGSGELYDHSKDPLEHINLIYPKNALEKHIAIAKQLAQHIPSDALQGK